MDWWAGLWPEGHLLHTPALESLEVANWMNEKCEVRKNSSWSIGMLDSCSVFVFTVLAYLRV